MFLRWLSHSLSPIYFSLKGQSGHLVLLNGRQSSPSWLPQIEKSLKPLQILLSIKEVSQHSPPSNSHWVKLLTASHSLFPIRDSLQQSPWSNKHWALMFPGLHWPFPIECAWGQQSPWSAKIN